MRILWLDTSPEPWKQSNGWEYLRDFQLDFIRVANVAEARARLNSALPLALAVINADLENTTDLIAEIKSGGTQQNVPVLLVSTTWGKKDFKSHSISPHPADNYARLPIPASGFVDVVAQLCNTTRAELEVRAENISPEGSDLGFTSVTIQSAPMEGIAAEDPSELLLDSGNAEKGNSGKTIALQMSPPEPPKPKSTIQALKEAITPWKKGESIPEEIPARPKKQKSPPAIPVTPLGSYNNADAEVLRNYLDLREQELSRSLRDKQSLEQLYEKVSKEIEELRRYMRELEHMKAEAEGRADRQEKRYTDLEKALADQKEKSDFEKETLLGRIKYLESQLEESKDRYTGLKDRVRKDIRKIQTREKELETRLELVKRDSETLIAERDRQVFELKRKIDALEFDLDLIQDRKVQAETNANRYVDKLSRVARTLQVAFGMLEEVEEEKNEPEFTKPITGGAAANTKGSGPAISLKSDEADIERLLKTPAKELDSDQLQAAEAPTRVFNKESTDADQLLAGMLDSGGGEQAEAGDASAIDDLDQALGQ